MLGRDAPPLRRVSGARPHPVVLGADLWGGALSDAVGLAAAVWKRGFVWRTCPGHPGHGRRRLGPQPASTGAGPRTNSAPSPFRNSCTSTHGGSSPCPTANDGQALRKWPTPCSTPTWAKRTSKIGPRGTLRTPSRLGPRNSKSAQSKCRGRCRFARARRPRPAHLGHTVGHAVSPFRATAHPWLHGEAVAPGLKFVLFQARTVPEACLFLDRWLATHVPLPDAPAQWPDAESRRSHMAPTRRTLRTRWWTSPGTDGAGGWPVVLEKSAFEATWARFVRSLEKLEQPKPTLWSKPHLNWPSCWAEAWPEIRK